MYRNQPKRRAFLHIGPAKTGSTPIQYFCDDHRDKLEKAGILYPVDHWHAQLGSYASVHPLSFVYNRLSGRTDPKIIKTEDAAFVSRLTEEIDSSDAQTVVLSYEGFIDLSKGAIKRISKYLRKRELQTNVVFYCRNPVAIAVSNISQAARMGLTTPLELDGGERRLPIVRYATQVPKFVKVFGRKNVIARHFDNEALVGGSILHDFFDVMGFDFEGLFGATQTPRLNASLSENGIRLALKIRDISERRHDPWNFDSWFGRFLNQVKGPPLMLSNDQYERLEAVTRAHTDYIHDEFGIDMQNPAPAHEDATNSPQVRPLSSAESEEIARKVLDAQTKVEMETGSEGRYWPSLHSEYDRIAAELNARLTQP